MSARIEWLTFWGQFMRRPQEVSALAPSSAALAETMARQLPYSARRVAEFGPGLGSITRALLGAGIRRRDLSLLEVNPDFCAHLRAAFPGVAVHQAPAQALADVVPEGLDAVVSGLPLLSMRLETQRAILSAAFTCLSPDGVYIQFTYGPAAPVRPSVSEGLGLSFTRTTRVWTNLPPATVYVYRRGRAEHLRYPNGSWREPDRPEATSL